MSIMSWVSKLLCRRGQNSAFVKKRKRTPAVPADNPIKKPEDDVLGRAKAAQTFAEQILLLDVTEGSVVGVLGAWGSGKTSFVNLVRTHWEKNGIPVLDFNPWMFSGTEQLARSFFYVLSSEMRLRSGLAEVGKGLENFGKSVTSLSWWPIKLLGTGLFSLGYFLKRGKEGIDGQRQKVDKALRKLNRPIVVVVDDIDRLTTTEIRDMFKLVRLTANFPNVIYIVAFDRERVEEALGGEREKGTLGRAYLEKIMQFYLNVPVVSEHLLREQIRKAINNTLSGIDDHGPFDTNAFVDVFAEIIRPLIRNMRDVRRYATAVHAALRELGSQVALVDVLALEAVNVFLPDVFRQLQRAIEDIRDFIHQGTPKRITKHINQWITTAGDRSDVVKSVVIRLFEGESSSGELSFGSGDQNQWLLDRRVAHVDILRFYLERVVSNELQAFYEAEKSWVLMSNRDEFDSSLRLLDRESLEDAIASLEVFENQFAPEHAVPGTVVLLNLLPELPERRHDIIGFGTESTVRRVIYRLLRPLGGHNEVEVTIRTILPQVDTLSAKRTLIDLVGYLKDVGHKLVSESAFRKFDRDWRDEVRAANEDALVKDTKLITILLRAQKEAKSGEPQIKIPDSPRLTLALLRSASYEDRSQDLGSLAIYSYKRLHWDALMEVYGDEQILCERIEALKASPPEDCKELLAFATKYSRGWRPNYRDERLQSHR